MLHAFFITLIIVFIYLIGFNKGYSKGVYEVAEEFQQEGYESIQEWK